MHAIFNQEIDEKRLENNGKNARKSLQLLAFYDTIIAWK